jgi:DNA-binding response OmpR family regulator/predicted regulator of Ras-like GTPase activity (Roadblock/LC7/MglB family)
VPQKRILLVDDEPNVVKSCAKMLELEGFSVKGVTSGKEAIESYHHDHFDLVLTDLKMPEIDGLEVLTEVRKHNPNAAVVIFTAYGTKESVVEALRLGAREFLEKPLDTKSLVATVRQILAQENGTAVRGNLRTMSLPSIFQINCTERNNARLSIKHGRHKGNIYFADGEVVHATLGSEVGEEAVYRLLSWKDADFELEMDILAPERTVTTGWSGLLLEGMRRIDEESAGGADALDELETETADQAAGTEKGVMGDMLQELAKALKAIENVTGVVIASRDGVVLADVLEGGDPEREGAVAVFVGNAAGVVGDPLALGAFQWGTANVGDETVLVLDQQEYHVGLILGKRASPAMVAASAQGMLRNGAQ